MNIVYWENIVSVLEQVEMQIFKVGHFYKEWYYTILLILWEYSQSCLIPMQNSVQ